MSISHLEYLQHILDETEYLLKESINLSLEQFLQDNTLKRAFVRSIEIIGEATKKIPDDLRRKHAHIDWRAMAGMRDKLIHGYFGVDYEIVWDVVKNKIPVLFNENQYIDLGTDGKVVSLTIEHAKAASGKLDFSYETVAA
jgi:uncharacterized protein with HEPN domain